MPLSSRSSVHSSNSREGGRPRTCRALGPPRSESQPFARAARSGHQGAPAPLASRFRGAPAVSRRLLGRPEKTEGGLRFCCLQSQLRVLLTVLLQSK